MNPNQFWKQNFLVSNPWREAIEVEALDLEEILDLVSNPWREAIEEPTAYRM